MRTEITAALAEARSSLDRLLHNARALEAIEAAGEVLVGTFRAGGRVFSCGNGGSMCDAMHFAEELSGRYRLDRQALAATAISDPGHLTCVANDYGYDQVFSRYLEAHSREGDCLVVLSTSGSSANARRAAEAARARGVRVIALTGREDAPLGSLATVHICTPGGEFADRVQELHIKVVHILIELVERALFPANYAGPVGAR